MATFNEAYLFAKKQNRTKGTSKRFKEILQIVRSHYASTGFTAEGAANLLEDLGPTFVKLGQIASAHPDVLPREYCDAFARLRTSVAPMSIETVQSVIESELGGTIDECFDEFDEQAVGSASIAQVHRAVLKETGDVVAIKVQRPEVVDIVAEDLAILGRIIELYDFVSEDENKLSLKELLDELARTSREELDFKIEAHNMERFYEHNAEREGIISPRCFEKQSSSKILTQDFLTYPCIGADNALEGMDEAQRKSLAYRLAQNYVQQIMDDGFFHADPHPGNVLVSEVGEIGWIDFGMMGTLTNRNKEQLLAIIRAFVRGDSFALQRALLKVVEPTGPVDHGKIIDMCETLIEEFIDVDLESFDISAFIEHLMGSLSNANFRIAPFLVSLGRGLTTLEGSIKLICPKLNIMSVITEYMRDNANTDDQMKKLKHVAINGLNSAEAMIGLPSRAAETLDMLQKGQVKVGMNLEVDNKFTSEIADAISYFAFAILACGMIIGSCILCTTNLQPQLLGIPAVGFAGFIFGCALMIYVTYLIFKRRSKKRQGPFSR